MTAYAGIGARHHGLPSLREVGLWAGAALVVLATHAVIAYAIHASQPEEAAAAAFEPALMIDLTPLTLSTPEAIESESMAEETPEEVVQPVDTAEAARAALAPETVKAEAAENAEPEKVEAETAEAAEPETIEAVNADTAEPETAEAVTPEAVQPEVAEPTLVEPELTAPEVATLVTPEVVLPVPQPRPIVEEEPKKEPEAKAKKAETKKTETKKTVAKKAEKQETKKVAKAEAAPAPKSKASAESLASKAPTISPAKWQSRVVAWLNRHKRYPGGAKSRREQGTVSVAFAINASGSVLSVRITRSSGNSELDQAALDMVRRASPVPAPPPEIAKSKMNLAVPVQFSLR